jgi:hypothetical protein
MSDWRKTSTGKPSKSWISYLRKAAKIHKDMMIKKDKDKVSKELTKLQYKSVLRDIKDYSKDNNFKKLDNNLVWRYGDWVKPRLFSPSAIKKRELEKKVKPKKIKTVKPKTKTKTVKKTKTTKKTKSKKKKTTSKKKK